MAKHAQRATMTFILFGATGDLAKRKIIPALFNLMDTDKFIVVMTGYEASSVKEILKGARTYIKGNINAKKWEKFVGLFRYINMDIHNIHSWRILQIAIESFEEETNLKRHRIFYCAVASHYFSPITENLVLLCIIRTGKGTWDRVIYEKPFGKNLKDAQEINECISEYLEERQIFRVDHYLAKGFLSLLEAHKMYMDVGNERNSKHIDYVTIYNSEVIGTEGRAYYDEYGAISDMVQSHLLQLLAIIVQDTTKIDALNDVVFEGGYRGQYKDYVKELGKASKTETLAELRFKINNERWKDTQFTITTGKLLKERVTSIVIHFKHRYRPLVIKDYLDNSEYEKLIFGNRRYCVTKEEIERQWQIVDDIKARNLDLQIY